MPPANRIAEGHAGGKHHVESRGCEHPRLFEAMINDRICSLDIALRRPGGGMFFESRKNALPMIVAPGRPDPGTAFRRAGGAAGARDYLDQVVRGNRP